MFQKRYANDPVASAINAQIKSLTGMKNNARGKEKGRYKMELQKKQNELNLRKQEIDKELSLAKANQQPGYVNKQKTPKFAFG